VFRNQNYSLSTHLHCKLSPSDTSPLVAVCGFLLLSARKPLILPKLGVEAPHLQPTHLQSEARAELLQFGFRLVVIFLLPLPEDIPVVANKQKVTLVVKRDHLSAFEFWLIVGKEAPEKTPRPVSNPSVEVVQHKLGVVIGARSMVFDILSVDNIRYLEISGRTRGNVGYDHTIAHLRLFAQDHQVGKLQSEIVRSRLPKSHQQERQPLATNNRTGQKTWQLTFLLLANRMISLIWNSLRG